MTSNAVLGYATFPDADVARFICGALVTEGLIACANILPPVEAIYAWEGKINREVEVAAILKTDSSRTDAVTRRFLDLHPYDTPALTFVDVVAGNPDFLKWLGALDPGPAAD